MRHYEAVVLFSPVLVGEGFEQIKKSFEEQVKKQGGSILSHVESGKKALAYTIKKQKEALIVVFDVQLAPEKVVELKKTLTLTEGILRFTIHHKVAVTAPSASNSGSQATIQPRSASRASHQKV